MKYLTERGWQWGCNRWQRLRGKPSVWEIKPKEGSLMLVTDDECHPSRVVTTFIPTW